MMILKQQENSCQSNQSGFTIIESLMAIIVVSILMIALSPVIVMSVATRVQSRRVEMGAQAAQSYIDALRAETIPPPTINDASSNSLTSIPAPPPGTLTCTSGAYCTAPTSATSQLYCVDGDGGGCTSDSVKDMIVQSFGVNKATSSLTGEDANKEKAKQGYQLGIRVYRADAFSGNEPLRPTPQDISKKQKTTQSPVTGGLGDRKAPVVEITTEVVTEDTGYNDFINRLN